MKILFLLIAFSISGCSTMNTSQYTQTAMNDTPVQALDDLNHPRCGVGW